MPPVIRIENLSKSYRIEHGRQRGEYRTLRESLTDAATWPLRKLRGQSNGSVEEFWALKDINLEIQQGEVVGIIGRNGAGKSTLLKILSRITAPTTGRVELHGRVGSLLEVGTGFHNELTGRENIFLNGSILGMTKSEIQKNFDSIVDFSGIEKFLDTPVKRYSSGMYVRLAFAVAAHLEPEIMIVDEVLAVGDAEFQKKCMGKMSEVAKGGRTILFVSHNMIAVNKLCSRAVLLEKGQLMEDGLPCSITNSYLSTTKISAAEVFWKDASKAPGNELVRFHAVRVRNDMEVITAEIDSTKPFKVEIEYWNLWAGAKLGATIVLYNQEGICVFSSISNQETNWHSRCRPIGLFRSVCCIPDNLLPGGRFTVSVLLWGEKYTSGYKIDNVLEFDILEMGGARGDFLGYMTGVVRPLLEWRTEMLSESNSDETALSHSPMIRIK